MIEFVKLIVDVVLKAVPGIVSRNERDKAAYLGADLFLIYVQINDVLVRAEQIVTQMERYDRASDHEAATARGDLLQLVPEQISDIKAITERLQALSWELQVLDGQSVVALDFLLGIKSSALDALSYALTLDHLPLGTTSVEVGEEGVRWPDIRPAWDARWMVLHSLREELGGDNPTREDEARRIRAYLEHRQPREEMRAIRENLERLREAIAANFTIQDILIRAGDPRLERRRGRR
ncbi:hypothetical protein SAMN05428985_104250 [Nocardioides sp. YR527]|uniref:hypothetical protein n=1 Tax=Nocardioides sp. YR527 TaxID=1881028 RepID=UPI000881F044|nr:hypothetical protein [Nocardioides sp. YR527]SDK49804.1 hypothetical protein SAMN05428985_104250 [Nocardioides sp. YR527]